MTTKQDKAISIISVVVGRVRSSSETFAVYEADRDEPIETGSVQEWRGGAVKQFFGPVSRNQRWTLAGGVVVDPKWGTQFVAQFSTPGVPRNWRELEALLISDLVDGWGWEQCNRLVESLGRDQALEACTGAYDLLETVPSITEAMVVALQETMKRGAGLAAIYSNLANWGIGGKLADKLVKEYGFAAARRVEENPYAPIVAVDGYGWRTAESAGRALGIALDDPRRITAGIEVAVGEATWEEGSTWLTRHQALRGAGELLRLGYAVVDEAMDTALAAGRVVQDGDHIQPAALHDAEYTIAGQVAARLHRKGQMNQEAVDALAKPEDISDAQWHAVCMALSCALSTLTGGPGVGKTTSLRTLVGVCQREGIPVSCMAPTGKAAARMGEATGIQATTIHSRLGLVPGKLGPDRDVEPLNGLVIVDEISMLDTTLAAQLFRGCSQYASILLVGDPDQLPSVGPGAVLRDLLQADLIPRIHLDKVYRNDAGVAIQAKRIREDLPLQDMDDVQLIESSTPEQTAAITTELVYELTQGDTASPGLLVLTPQNDGPGGRYALNAVLQPMLNDTPAGGGITHYIGSSEDPDGTLKKRQEELRVGDRVMVTKNLSELDVFNGQTGTVTSVDRTRSITVEIDGRRVKFEKDDKHSLTLAYAITGHKSQGSEAAIVIVPVLPSRVLCREWVYTVLTRAKERCYFIGDISALQAALSRRISQDRKTMLVQRVEKMVAPYSDEWDLSDDMFAHADGQAVFHYRRQAAPWLTCCGQDTRREGWEETDTGSLRLCLHCAAATATPVYRIQPVEEAV